MKKKQFITLQIPWSFSSKTKLQHIRDPTCRLRIKFGSIVNRASGTGKTPYVGARLLLDNPHF